MTVFITLTLAGANVGPFNLYSNVDGYVTAFESGVSSASLLAGYASSLVPDGTTTIRLLSTGECNNYFDIVVDTPTTYTLKRCGDDAPFTVNATYPFSVYDVIQFQIGIPGAGTVYCGEIGGFNTGMTPDAEIYSPVVYSCSDVINCP